MSFITGKHLQRRTFLRGMGASVALPFLDAMVPAGVWGRSAAEDGPTRLIAIEVPHGHAGGADWGREQFLFAPERIGRDFEIINASALTPLEPYREYLTIVSNTDCRMAEAHDLPEVGGDHPRSAAVFLTQSHPLRTESSDVFVGTSLDQIYAQQVGRSSAIPSMQLAIETIDSGGGCFYGYSCTYQDTISWASPSQPLPSIRDPRVAFDQLFGVGGTATDRSARRRTQQSILDVITADLAHLKVALNPEDRVRMDRYLENVREIERRIQGIEARNTSGEQREIPDAPPGVPDSVDEHIKLMLDLQVLGFQADMTRIFSFKLGRDLSSRVYTESGNMQPFHSASHHVGKPEQILDYNLINRYHVSTLTHLLDQLKDSMEGDAHLLDKTMIIYGGTMGDSNIHNHRRCPLVVLGHANGQLEGNVHLKAPDRTPMANAMLTLMQRLGLKVEDFGDSTGEFALSTSSSPAVTGS